MTYGDLRDDISTREFFYFQLPRTRHEEWMGLVRSTFLWSLLERVSQPQGAAARMLRVTLEGPLVGGDLEHLLGRNQHSFPQNFLPT